MAGPALHQTEAAVKTALVRILVIIDCQMPFARHHGAIALRFQGFSNRHHAIMQLGAIFQMPLLIFGMQMMHGADAGSVIADAGHQHGAGRRAGGSDVKIGHESAVLGQRVKGRGLNATAEPAHIRPAHIIGDDDDEVRFFVRRRKWGRHHGDQ